MFHFPNSLSLFFLSQSLWIILDSRIISHTHTRTSTSVSSDLRQGSYSTGWNWIRVGAVWERMTQNSRQGHLIWLDWRGMWPIALEGAGMAPRLSHPRVTSSFSQYTIDKGKVCCAQVVSCSRKPLTTSFPYPCVFGTALIGKPGEIMLRLTGCRGGDVT